MNRELLFPTPIYSTEFPDHKKLNKELFKNIKAWSQKESNTVKTNPTDRDWETPLNK